MKTKKKLGESKEFKSAIDDPGYSLYYVPLYVEVTIHDKGKKNDPFE